MHRLYCMTLEGTRLFVTYVISNKYTCTYIEISTES